MTPSAHIDNRIAKTPGWKGEVYAKLRELILATDPEITEEWKWDTAVWSRNGMICAVSAFKEHVKINFFKGAQLLDQRKLINAGLDSKSHRSIDFHEGDVIDSEGITDLVREAISLNIKKK